MKRYAGEGLPARPRIALITNDAIGNYVVATPLLQMLRNRYPDGHIAYYGGNRTAELWRHDDRIDYGFPLFGSEPREALRDLSEREFDWVINIDMLVMAKAAAAAAAGLDTWITGPSLDAQGRSDLDFGESDRGDLWRDREWVSPDLAQRYPFLDSGFIGEIFARLAYLEGEVPSYRVPSLPPPAGVPRVLIAMTASLPDKLWTTDRWMELLSVVQSRYGAVGLLGAPPKATAQHWQGGDAESAVVAAGLVEDWRGRLSLREVAGALHQAALVLTLDNGIMHLAAAGPAPVVALFREGIHRLWTPPGADIRAVVTGAGQPVSEIAVEQVMAQLP